VNADSAVIFAAPVAAGFLVALLAVRVALKTAPPSLHRINVNRREVPVVLGFGVLFGSLAGTFAFVFARSVSEEREISSEGVALVVAVVLLMFAAGLFDDRRGDEPAKGFRGHVTSASSGALTGGLVKIIGGGLAGLIAAIPAEGWSHSVEVFLLVPLTANLFNLLDRAPGRAVKVALVMFLPLLIFGPLYLAVALAGPLGALLAVAGFDLRERAMLGDAGANPIGAVLGLALAYTLEEPWRVLAVLAIGGLNLASERVSFSRVIDSTPWLRALDRIGRK
jgi:Glycosyl transferase family 4